MASWGRRLPTSREGYDAKAKELTDNKDSSEKELQSLKDQVSNLHKTLNVEKLAKEEANKAAEESIEQLKKGHDKAIVDAREEGYNEAISVVADEMTSLKNNFYAPSIFKEK